MQLYDPHRWNWMLADRLDRFRTSWSTTGTQTSLAAKKLPRPEVHRTPSIQSVDIPFGGAVVLQEVVTQLGCALNRTPRPVRRQQCKHGVLDSRNLVVVPASLQVETPKPQPVRMLDSGTDRFESHRDMRKCNRRHKEPRIRPSPAGLGVPPSQFLPDS